MSSQITIIGLGTIGTSLGLILCEQKSQLTVIGCDLDKEKEKYAKELGAVTKTSHSLIKAVKEADMVLLTLSADQTKEVLELIGKETKEKTVILDFSPCKAAAEAWAKTYLKDSSLFVGIWAIPSPSANQEKPESSVAPFRSGRWILCPNAQTDKSVLDNAATLANIAKAEIVISDSQETDGLIARSFSAPLLLQTALFSSICGKSSWKSIQNNMGYMFAHATSFPAELTTKETTAILWENRENTLRAINDFVSELKKYRDILQQDNAAALEALLKETGEIYGKWSEMYKQNSPDRQNTTISSTPFREGVGQFFFGKWLRKKSR